MPGDSNKRFKSMDDILNHEFFKQDAGADVKTISNGLGVAAYYLIRDFKEIALQAVDKANKSPQSRAEYGIDTDEKSDFWYDKYHNNCDDYKKNPTFHDIAPALCRGPKGMGKGKTCPRDGTTDCSVVDALHYEDQQNKKTADAKAAADKLRAQGLDVSIRYRALAASVALTRYSGYKVSFGSLFAGEGESA